MSYGLQDDGSYKPLPRIQDSLSQLLSTLGFKAMAEDVLNEEDNDQLQRYAQVVSKNLPEGERKIKIISALRVLKLI